MTRWPTGSQVGLSITSGEGVAFCVERSGAAETRPGRRHFRRQINGHGRTCYLLGPVANDQTRTFRRAAQKTKSPE